MILLPQNVAHIWMLDLRTVPDARLEDYQKLLSEEELARLEHYRAPGLRRAQLITRAAVRFCLSQYSESVSPAKWQIEIPENGKPQLRQPAPLPMSFNLSHSGDWVVIAMTVDTAIGVDIQQQRAHHSVMDLARRYFHANEVTALECREGRNQKELFFRLWTLKESYFKARGSGIATGLDKVRFQIDNNGLITADIDSQLEDHGEDWQFHHYHLGTDYCLSLALQQPRVQSASPSFYKVIPQELVEPLDLEAHQIRLH